MGAAETHRSWGLPDPGLTQLAADRTSLGSKCSLSMMQASEAQYIYIFQGNGMPQTKNLEKSEELASDYLVGRW